MPNLPPLSRRKALQFLASAPLLPLGTSAAAASLLSACGGTSYVAPPAPQYRSTSFASSVLPALSTPAAMASTTVSSMLNVQFSDNSTQSYKLAYQPFFITGDMVADGKGGTVLAGGYVDINNKPILDTSVPGKERQFFSDSPDGTSLLSLPNPSVTGIKGKAVFAVVQFEYTTRAGRLRRQQPATGRVQQKPVRQRGHRQSLPLRPPAGSDGQPGRHRLDQEALLPGPHLA